MLDPAEIMGNLRKHGTTLENQDQLTQFVEVSSDFIKHTVVTFPLDPNIPF